MKNLSQMMKQAQQMQEKMQEMQSALGDMEIEGTSGGGLVTVKLNGKGEMLGLKIDPTLVTPDDIEVLEDLVVAAHGDAKAKAEAKSAEEMSKLTGGLQLPPGFKLPF